jgi:two-component system, response regulator
MSQTECHEVLLVEDNPDDAELVLRTFRKKNLANIVHWAKDGKEAIEFLSHTQTLPCLVLLDLKLPKVDGLTVLAHIRKNTPTAHIPVVVMTSSAMEADLKAVYGLHGNAFVIKPIEYEAFATAVETLGLFWIVVNKPLN